MSVSLPYEFDSTNTARKILLGVAGLLLLIAFGIVYSLAVARSSAAALQLALCGVVLTVFWRIVSTKVNGARGTITKDGVWAYESRLLGFRLRGPAGQFRVSDFRTVDVEQVVGAVGPQGTAHDRVWLRGRDARIDILVARAPTGSGSSMGRDLAGQLNLPYEERTVPY